MGISTSALTSSLRFCDNKDQQLLALPQIEFSWTLLDLPSILRTGRPLKSIFVEEKVKEKTRYQNIPYPSSPKKIQSRNSNLPLFGCRTLVLNPASPFLILAPDQPRYLKPIKLAHSTRILQIIQYRPFTMSSSNFSNANTGGKLADPYTAKNKDEPSLSEKGRRSL